MLTAGIVAEYNPFHNGHEAHIEATRAALGPDTGIICCMSGDFVQRGEPAQWSKFARAEAAAGDEPLVRVEPFRLRTAAVIATGSEVASGLIEDRFTPVMVEKLAAYGIETVLRATPGDDREDVVTAIDEARSEGVDLIMCTGGMSVDPDDNTPGAIRAAGARVVTYGAPVLPGAMLLVGYFDEPGGRSVPVLGVPGCAMYSRATVLDLVLPRIAAGVPIERADLVRMGEGGLCLGCPECTFPHCPFGR